MADRRGRVYVHDRLAGVIEERDGTVRLTPAYDLLATRLLLPEDREEMALSLNGKRARLDRSDFVALGRYLQLAERAIDASFERFEEALPSLIEQVERSFLGPSSRERYAALIADRWDRLAAR